MSRRGTSVVRWALGITCFGGGLLACSLVQSLDYLQTGVPETGVIIDEPSPPGRIDAETGTLLPIAENQTKPMYLVLAGDAVYWTTGSMVLTAPKVGGGPTRTVATLPGPPTELAADPGAGPNLYASIGRDVFQIPKAGGTPVKIYTGSALLAPLTAVAADETSVFALHYDEGTNPPAVVRMIPDGGAPSLLGPDGGSPSTLAIDALAAVWFFGADEGDTQGFTEVPKSSPPGTPGTSYVISNEDAVPESSRLVALNGDTIFWTDGPLAGGGNIQAKKRNGADPVLTLYRANGLVELTSVAADGTHVYATDRANKTLFRVKRDGTSSAEILADGLEVPGFAVVDDQFVYFAQEGTGVLGSIQKVAKSP